MKTSDHHHTWSSQIDASGRLLIPVETRNAMNWQRGTEVVLESDGDSLRILTRDQFTKEVQSLFGAWQPGDPLLSEELISERRQEAEHERRS